jgi:hydrogenase-4 component F
MAEMLILSGIVQTGNLIAFTLMCTMLTIIFVATGRSIFPMIWGPSDHAAQQVEASWVTAVPKFGFVLALVLLGVYTPAPISALLLQVAQSIGG